MVGETGLEPVKRLRAGDLQSPPFAALAFTHNSGAGRETRTRTISDRQHLKLVGLPNSPSPAFLMIYGGQGES